ncbi:hypothetical protein AAB992_39010 [Burkholderia contaminans]|uniref:hypothetical protein n=1 Tax=Burkholderia contaminans TaxID=488447 RepID=UPI002416B83C|nr:hypothetical protein [Burkholderia contaminans]WFN14447.1 hypothetical protein LXE92_36685 [Burkholderia contaminans]
MIKRLILPISYAATIIFLTGLLAFGCSAYLIKYVGFCALFFSVGVVASVFLFLISFFAKNGSNLAGFFGAVVWVAALVVYFYVMRRIFINICYK